MNPSTPIFAAAIFLHVAMADATVSWIVFWIGSIVFFADLFTD